MQIETLTESHRLAGQRREQATTSIYLTPVEDRAGTNFQLALRALLSLADETTDPRAQRFIDESRMIRWTLSVDALPIRTEYSFANGCFVRMAQLFQDTRANVGRSLSVAMQDVLDRAEVVSSRASSPLGESLLEDLTDLGGDAVVVVPRGGAAPPLERWLEECGVQVSAVMAPGNFILDRLWGPTICLGAPATFESNDRNFLQPLLLAPASDSLAFCYPTWSGPQASGDQLRLSTGLLEGGSAASVWGRLSPIRLDHSAVDLDFQSIESGPAIASSGHTYGRDIDSDIRAIEASLVDGGAETDCVRLELALGFHFYLETTADRLRGAQIRNGRLEPRTLRASSLSVGEYVVARIGISESVDLRVRAFTLLGDEGSRISDSQEQWKSRLILRAGQVGWSEVAAALRRRGSRVVGQERRWSSALAIKPRHESDFMVLMDYLGFDEAHALVSLKRAKRLDSAVRVAARVLNAELIRNVDDVRTIEENGGGVFGPARGDSPEQPVLVAQVLSISNSPVSVPLSMVRRAIGIVE